MICLHFHSWQIMYIQDKKIDSFDTEFEVAFITTFYW